MATREQKRKAIELLKGRDRVGVAGELVGTGVAAAGGAAASGAIASAFGATTLLGSSTVGSLLGGVFVASTPMGWVVGSALAAGAVGYGIARLCSSGGTQDQRRRQLIEELEELEELEERGEKVEAVNALLPELVTLHKTLAEFVTDIGLLAQSEKIVALVEEGRLDPAIAIRRLNAVIEAVRPPS